MTRDNVLSGLLVSSLAKAIQQTRSNWQLVLQQQTRSNWQLVLQQALGLQQARQAEKGIWLAVWLWPEEFAASCQKVDSDMCQAFWI